MEAVNHIFRGTGQDSSPGSARKVDANLGQCLCYASDVVIVIGSNDIVNPAANDDPNSPIAGMPVLHVWEATDVFVSKRGTGTGYSGIENPLFYKDNTRMFYGDAKDSVNELLKKL